MSKNIVQEEKASRSIVTVLIVALGSTLLVAGLYASHKLPQLGSTSPTDEKEVVSQSPVLEAALAGAGNSVKSGSGLQYYDLKSGDGPFPPAGSKVTVHYTGWLSNNKKFDSSLDRGQPFTFTLGAGQVIKGFDEGLATMQVGGKRRLFIPAQLAYGQAGAPPTIPPNSALVFELELLSYR